MTQPKTVVGLGRDIEFKDSWDLAQIVRLWSSAAGPELDMSQRMVRYYVEPADGVWQSGRFAEFDGRPVGLVWITAARRLNRDPGLSGFVEMLCVVSEYQRRGIGTRLLGWAEDMLADQACERIVLGGGFRYPLNCLPLELGSQDYFRGRGYADGVAVWDVARDLVGFEADYEIGEDDVSIVEASEADHAELFEFLASTYPRWAIELTDFHQGRGPFFGLSGSPCGRSSAGFLRSGVRKFSRAAREVPWLYTSTTLGRVGANRSYRVRSWAWAWASASSRRIGCSA